MDKYCQVAENVYLCTWNYYRYNRVYYMDNQEFQLEGIRCADVAFALRDTMNAISGKWRLAVVGVMLVGHSRFIDIQRALPSITPRMLSKELKELEMNGVVQRIVEGNTPSSIRYQLTPTGRELKDVIYTLMRWGQRHRQKQIK